MKKSNIEIQLEKIIQKQFPTWKVEKLLGSGHFGFVFLINENFAVSKKRFALKIFVRDPIYEKGNKEIFLDRVLSCGRQHYTIMKKIPEKLSGVVEIIDGHVIGESAAIRMEYLEGGSLHGAIQNQSLSFSQKLNIFEKTCRIIGHLHKNKIMHNDLKPENILLTQDLEPKLSDFDLTKEFNSKVKVRGLITGDRRYMPPEIIGGKNPDLRTDIYSLGVTGFELFVGENPFASMISNSYYFSSENKRINYSDEMIDFFKNSKFPSTLQEAIIRAIQPEYKNRTIRAIEMADLVKRAYGAAYLTHRGKQSNTDILKNGYRGPVAFKIDEGRPLILVDDDLKIKNYFIVGKVTKVRNKNAYTIHVSDEKILKFKTIFKINRNSAKELGLKGKNNPDEILKQLKFLKSISYDAFEKLNET